MLKSGGYEVIKNPQKIKKWKKNQLIYFKYY